MRLGCDGVEGDQNNPYGNSPGFSFALKDEADWYLELASELHKRGLLAVMKNGVEIHDYLLSSWPTVTAAFDAALVEECVQFSECSPWQAAFVAKNKAVWAVEYQGTCSSISAVVSPLGGKGYLANKALDGKTWQACN